MNPRFAIRLDSNQNASALVSLIGKKVAQKGLGLSYSYAQPSAIHNQRVWNEKEVIAIDFISRMIPLWGVVVRKVNERIFQTPMRAAKLNEARLTQVLQDRQLRSPGEATGWEVELTTLAEQRINPFELSRAETIARVQARKTELGLNQ